MDKPKEVICRNCGSIDDYWTEFKNGQFDQIRQTWVYGKVLKIILTEKIL